MAVKKDLARGRKSGYAKTDAGLVPAPGMRVGPGPILADELKARGLSVVAFA